MKASKKPAPGKGEVELKGTVIEKTFGAGSKSEYTAIYLQTADGDYQLRRLGGNPFSDPELKKLVGEKVAVTGMISGALVVVAKEIKKV